MLQFIRERTTGLVAWGFVILITVPFALWGVHEYISPNPDVVLAEIEDTEIHYSDFQRAYARARQQYQEALGSGAMTEQQDRNLRSVTLNQMVMYVILDRSAADLGLRITDRQLAKTLQAQFFQGNSNLSREQYINILSRQGLTPERYENELRRQLLRQQLIQGIMQSAIITGSELVDIARLSYQQRVFSVLSFLPENYSEDLPDDATIQAFFEANRANFVIPEQIQVDYILISKAAIAANINASEEELRSLYETQKINYAQQEQIEASHILLQVEDDADESAWDKATERARELKSALDAGADFAALATDYSDDSGSAINGGSLGGFGRGIMVPAFEEAAFALAIGEISDPVRTEFGIHLILTTDHLETKTRPFAEVRAEILQTLQNREADQIYFEQAEQLATLTYENPELLETAAEQTALPIFRSQWFSYNGKGNDADLDLELFADPTILAAAFAPEAISSRENSQLLELNGERSMVLRVAERRQPRQQPLEEVQAGIVEQLELESTAAKARAAGNRSLGLLRSGLPAAAVAATADLSWVEYEALDRNSDAVDAILLQSVFRASEPVGGQPSYGGVVVRDGGYRVFSVTAVDDGNLGALTEEEREAVKYTLMDAHGKNAFIALQLGRRNASQVYISNVNLNAAP